MGRRTEQHDAFRQFEDRGTDLAGGIAFVGMHERDAVDFVGTAEVGQWLAVESEVIKTGRTICFAQSLIKADDVVIARANATFRVVPKKEPAA